MEKSNNLSMTNPLNIKRMSWLPRLLTVKSKGIQIRELIPSTSHSSVSLWNIDTNKFHKVNVMMLSPNYWDEQGIGNKTLLLYVGRLQESGACSWIL